MVVNCSGHVVDFGGNPVSCGGTLVHLYLVTIFKSIVVDNVTTLRNIYLTTFSYNLANFTGHVLNNYLLDFDNKNEYLLTFTESIFSNCW